MRSPTAACLALSWLFLCGSVPEGTGRCAEPAAGSELFGAVAEARGEKSIHAATLTYTVTSVAAMPSENLVQQVVNDARKDYAEWIAEATTQEQQERLRAYRDRAEEIVREQLMANARTSCDVFSAISGPLLGGERSFEITERRDGRPPTTVETAYRHLGVGSAVAIHNERARSTVLVLGQPIDYGSQEPHRLGRLVGFLEQFAQHLESTSSPLPESSGTIAVTETESVQENQAWLVTVTFAGAAGQDPGSTTFTTVPSMGHVTPLVRDSLADGTVVAEWVSRDYVQVPQAEGDPLWFPLHVSYVQNDPAGHPVRSEEYTFRADALSLNAPVPADRFTIRLEPRTTVADTRVSPAASYSVKESVSLGLDDVDSLATNPALEPLVAQPRSDVPTAIPGGRSSRGLVVTLTLLALLAGALWWRRRRAAAAVLLLALGLPGCGTGEALGVPDAASDPGSPIVVSR